MVAVMVSWMLGVAMGFMFFPVLGEMYQEYHTRISQKKD